jgi:hypothetical protein
MAEHFTKVGDVERTHLDDTNEAIADADRRSLSIGQMDQLTGSCDQTVVQQCRQHLLGPITGDVVQSRDELRGRERLGPQGGQHPSTNLAVGTVKGRLRS